MKVVDLSDQKVITAREVEDAGKAGATEVVLRKNAIVTPAARDAAAKLGVTLRSGGPAPVTQVEGTYAPVPAAPVGNPAHEALFRSAEAQAVKAEICAVGRKLWQRQYVDGNGGNISYRIGPNEVICTPTLVSKGDLRPEDLCMVDLDGNQLVGSRPRTSEILLHLEIYKAVPEAKGVVHCHPPHATAYALTGKVPPSGFIPEYDVFIGSCAMSPYETPGTQKFAETVVPWVRHHNSVILANHGIVCWADTVTHAEWYAEVLDTYCWTLMLASQVGVPLTKIPEEKQLDLLEIKKKLGLPDRRLARECQLSDMPEMEGTIAFSPPGPCPPRPSASASASDLEAIVKAVTDKVMAALDGGGSRNS